jgi:hypothetical protein
MQVLKEAFDNGVEKSVKIFGRVIQYEPGIPSSTGISAVTNFEQNTFTLGPNAFNSEGELTKSLLQELYRLSSSKASGGLTGPLATQETKTTEGFVNSAFETFFTKEASTGSGGTLGGAAGGAAAGTLGGEILDEK